jgi:hypothetical protein
MFPLRYVRAVKSKTKLHGHVEPRNTAGRLYAREVMDGKIGLLDQFDDSRKAALVRNCQRNMNPQAELRQTNNVGEVQILKGIVVGHVEEYGFDLLSARHAILGRQLAAISLALLLGPFRERPGVLLLGARR